MPANPVSYGGFKRVRGDASRMDGSSGDPRGQLALLVPTNGRDLHFAEAADEATDWNVSNPTDPTIYIHSATTPATEYMLLSKSSGVADITVQGGGLDIDVSGSTIDLQIGSTSRLSVTATTTTVGSTSGLTVTAGGVTVTAGGLTVTAGNATFTATDLEMTAGTLALNDGGTVTQATNKSTGVTLSTHSGQITMNAASLAANTTVSFTLTNTQIEAQDVVIVHHGSAGTAASYVCWADTIAAGSCVINVRNETGGALAEAIVLHFAIIHGSAT